VHNVGRLVAQLHISTLPVILCNVSFVLNVSASVLSMFY